MNNEQRLDYWGNMKKDDKRKMENELQKALAIEFARTFCAENNLSLSALKKQQFHLAYNECAFAQPSNAVSDGLINDIETVPIVTLIIRCDADTLQVVETENTRTFLKK